MKLFGREVEGFPKALVVLAAVLLVSSGLCGLQWAISMGSQRDASGLIPLGILELVAIFVSAAGIVVVLLLWAVSAVYARFGKTPKNEVQKHAKNRRTEFYVVKQPQAIHVENSSSNLTPH